MNRRSSPAPNFESLQGIAVNPGPASGKDRLFVTGLEATREYDSAADGSALLDPEFAKGLISDLRRSIAVNGANGHVYFGLTWVVGPSDILVDSAGKEALARIDTKVSASGKAGGNPYVAVDQASGHAIEYDETKAAHEYNAVSGSFVAEFGNFTEGLIKTYRVAVDNACAIHVPQLTETTTPTCQDFDPANGNFYVAFDDTNASHPPFDVTAFGPLKYGTPPPTPKFKLTVKETGTGSGTVAGFPRRH